MIHIFQLPNVLWNYEYMSVKAVGLISSKYTAQFIF